MPKKIPWMITEYGYSAYARPAEVDLPAALFNLDLAGKVLELGGTAAFEYGYEPNKVISERRGEWGNLMMWLVDGHDEARYPLPAYWAARLLTGAWCSHDPRPHRTAQQYRSLRVNRNQPRAQRYIKRVFRILHGDKSLQLAANS